MESPVALLLELGVVLAVLTVLGTAARRYGLSPVPLYLLTVPTVLGGLMVVVGAVWTFQGLGYLEGSPMTGVDLWAIIGPIVAGLGVALAYVGIRGAR